MRDFLKIPSLREWKRDKNLFSTISQYEGLSERKAEYFFSALVIMGGSTGDVGEVPVT